MSLYCRLVCAAWLLLIACASSNAEEVSGQVTLPSKKAARLAVVYLSGDKKAAPLAKAVVDQRDKTFIPHVSVVTVGTKVQFPNNDSIFHNVFSYYQAKKFDLGMYPRGKTMEQTLEKAGLVVMLCNVHSEMSAYIMVVDTPYYAVCDSKGKFTIKDVPPGDYTLHGWHESGAEITKQVVIKADKCTLQVDLERK